VWTGVGELSWPATERLGVHEAARIIADQFPFYDAYRAWIARSFSAELPDR
jgi:hypothetical protein